MLDLSEISAARLADVDVQRTLSAIHEAAHAVVAYEFGWTVNHEGIEIDRRLYAGLQHRLGDEFSEEARACIHLAGGCAERKLTGRQTNTFPFICDDSELKALIDNWTPRRYRRHAPSGDWKPLRPRHNHQAGLRLKRTTKPWGRSNDSSGLV